MSLLGLSSTTQMYQSQAIAPVSPVRQAPERSPKTEETQEVVKAPQHDRYTPSQEGLAYVQTMSEEVSVDDTAVGDADMENMAEVDPMDGTYGSPTVMPELDQELDAAIPDDLIDPTDFTNTETYDPDAWLSSYRDEKVNQNTTEIGPSSGTTSEEEGVEEDTFDPTDFTNTETYNPYAWLANYRGEAIPEKETTTSTTVDTDSTVDTTVESTEVSTEETTESSFDLQTFLRESESVAKEVVSQLGNLVASYSETQNWLDLLQVAK